MDRETVLKLSDLELKERLIECSLNINGNRKQKEKRLLIAYGINTEFIIIRIDIITKYWIHCQINIPLDIIQLIALFCKIYLKFTIYNPKWGNKEKLIKFNKQFTEIECVSSSIHKYLMFVCSEYPINKMGSFSVEIIKRNQVMYIGLLSDYSNVKNRNDLSPMNATGNTLIWYYGNQLRYYINNQRICSKGCGGFTSGDTIKIKRIQRNKIEFYKNGKLVTVCQFKQFKDNPLPIIMYPFVSIYTKVGTKFRIKE